jgi:hypothetical protein
LSLRNATTVRRPASHIADFQVALALSFGATSFAFPETEEERWQRIAEQWAGLWVAAGSAARSSRSR